MKKIALVTGASKGLGKEICDLLLSNDYDVIGTYHNTFSSDDKIDFQKCDLKKENEINKLFDYIMNKYHHLDLLINNAALCLDNEFSDKTINEFNEVFKVNVFAPFELMKLFAIYNKKGTIINISSLDASDTFSTFSMDYAASKAALENLTKNFAKRLPNFKILALAPAWINTDTVLEMEPNYLKEEMKSHKQEHLLDKKKVALKVLDLINNNKYKSGMIIRMEDDYE